MINSHFVARFSFGSNVTNAADNPFGPNALTFVYLVQNNAVSADALGRLSVNGFTGFNTDVGMDPFGIGQGLIDCFENTRTADGESLGWSFLNLPGVFQQVAPGQSSSYFVVHTNATQYNWSTAAVIDGAIANANAWAPLPTPGAGALLGLGLSERSVKAGCSGDLRVDGLVAIEAGARHVRKPSAVALRAIATAGEVLFAAVYGR